NRWAWGAVGMALFNTVVVPNGAPWNDCKDQCPGCSPDDSLFSNAQSNHPGGVNVLMADGSARFIKSSISPLTWMQLGTRANGDIVSADAYGARRGRAAARVPTQVDREQCERFFIRGGRAEFEAPPGLAVSRRAPGPPARRAEVPRVRRGRAMRL